MAGFFFFGGGGSSWLLGFLFVFKNSGVTKKEELVDNVKM